MWRPTRCLVGCRRVGFDVTGAGQPLVRAVRRLPRILEPDEVGRADGGAAHPAGPGHGAGDGAGRSAPCEVLGLRLEDLRLGEWRVFINEGKGGHQRLVPVSPSFFATVAAYMDTERPAGLATDRVFVVLKGPDGASRCRPTARRDHQRRPGPGRAGPRDLS